MKRRRFTKRFFDKAALHYAEHGWKATAARFRISGSTMQKVKAASVASGGAGLTSASGGPVTETPTGRSLYLAAKALERALLEHRRAGNPNSDIEQYAYFLLKEILK